MQFHPGMADLSTLSLLGENHQNHDSFWTMSGVRPQSLLCVACLTEVLEKSDELVLKKKFLLGELLCLLTSTRNEIWDILTENEDVLEHLHRTIFSKILIERLFN